MKVAIVYDRVNKWGGAERVLLALHDIWPDAPLFTAVYDKKRAAWAHVFRVQTSFLQSFPLARRYHELYPWVTPLAFETFRFDGFDLVISVTSAEAKGIITKPQTTHICYCLTPTRYLWSGFREYQKSPGWGILNRPAHAFHTALTPTLRRWDRIAAARPDAYIAISERVAQRIKRYYGRMPIATIYPPVDTAVFKPGSSRPDGFTKNDYYLVVSRMVGHKRLDLIIDAFNAFRLPLVVIGRGVQKRELVTRAGRTIQFIDRYLTDKEMARYYGNCRALVFVGEEDFGLTAVEAQACGRPVIAYRKSGISEIIEDGKTGVLISDRSRGAMRTAIQRLESHEIQPDLCRGNAMRFSIEQFRKKMRSTIENYHDTHVTV